MKLEDKVAVITGSARGIGCAIAEAMAAAGARVVITDRDGEAAAKTAQRIGDAAIAVTADVSEPAQIEALFAEAERAFGRIDILVNNAGIGAPRLVLDIGLEEWERTIRINLTGSMLCSQQAARRMIAQGTGGKIVNIVSLSGQKGGVGRGAYGASKAGLEVLTKIMAVELADHGITVNAIAPGPIMTEVGRTMHTKETVEAYHRLIPQRRGAIVGRLHGVASLLQVRLHQPNYLLVVVDDQNPGFIAGIPHPSVVGYGKIYMSCGT